MSDTSVDYLLNVPVIDLLNDVSSKTFSFDFDEQLDISEELYGQHIQFSFSKEDIQAILQEETFNSEIQKERVYDILTEQRRKYQYLFNARKP